MDITLEHNDSKGIILNQTRDLLAVNMSNSTRDGMARYSVQYTGSRFNDISLNQTQFRQELQFRGNSKLSDHAELYSSARNLYHCHYDHNDAVK